MCWQDFPTGNDWMVAPKDRLIHSWDLIPIDIEMMPSVAASHFARISVQSSQRIVETPQPRLSFI
jgi:hypothetical protein